MEFNTFKEKMNRKDNFITFSFGKNWKNYIKTLTKEKILIAKKSLVDFLGDVKNKTFLDIGCGSGLFSYSMYLLGAKKITSFDIDSFSIQCTKFLHNKVKNPEKWKICMGSILDKKFISQIGKFDIVYSWGVLHHTGNMWDAIRNATSLVNDDGILFIAIYNKTAKSKIWVRIKKLYNRCPKIGKIIMNVSYFLIGYFFWPLVNLNNPFGKLKEYQKNRGMSLFIDIMDWLGGYPFQYATFKEIKNFIIQINSKFELIKYKKVDKKADGNNEFLFKKIK